MAKRILFGAGCCGGGGGGLKKATADSPAFPTPENWDNNPFEVTWVVDTDIENTELMVQVYKHRNHPDAPPYLITAGVEITGLGQATIHLYLDGAESEGKFYAVIIG